MKPEINIPQPTSEMCLKNRALKVTLFGFVALTWTAGIYLHDPWTIPSWPLILLVCSILTVVSYGFYLLLMHGSYILASVGFMVVCIFTIFIVPLNSFTRVAIVENQTKASIRVRFSTLDKTRFKQVEIKPGGEWRFVYFGGDNDGRKGISCILEISNLSYGALVRTQVDLPIVKAGPNFKISEEWFLENELKAK